MTMQGLIYLHKHLLHAQEVLHHSEKSLKSSLVHDGLQHLIKIVSSLCLPQSNY